MAKTRADSAAVRKEIQQQFGGCDTVLVSPGSDRCLWITNQAHLDRLQARLGRRVEAAQAYRVALDLADNEVERDFLRRRLGETSGQQA